MTGLDERSPFHNKRYEDLDESSQRKLRQSVLRAINIRQLSPKNENTSIYHIFERLNTGGTPLRPQEIRNCVFRGGFVAVLKTLNELPSWRKITGKLSPDTHQKDVELILRVFALSGGGALKYEKPMKEFLNLAMEHDRSGTSSKVKRFAKRFEAVCELLVKEVGEKPFHVRGPLNSSALDAIMVTLIDNSTSIRKDLAKRYEKLLGNDAFISATFYGTSDVSVLHSRFSQAKKMLIG